MNHIIEHCGNFSPEVLKGLIGYGRELNQDRSEKEIANNLSKGDGYATKEGDILLGGFIQRRAVQRAYEDGKQFYSFGFQEKEELAHQIAKEHLRQFGTVGNEHYRRWMVRARAFAKYQKIVLPEQFSNERDHQYFRRVRKWIKNRDEKWPELRSGAGAHLVLSPDPKIWKFLRSSGVDERFYLRNVLTQTVREFSDWRRKEVGVGHSLGWIAGTHVEANGADRHPHIHLIVLKRDEMGREVDWSVSALKGYRAKNSPDPLREFKRLFSKNVERQLEQIIGKEAVRTLQTPPVISKRPLQFRPQTSLHHFRKFARGLKAVFRVMQPYRIPGPRFSVEHTTGSLIRQITMFQKSGSKTSLSTISEKISSLLRENNPTLER